MLLDEDTYKRAIETIIVKFYVENNPFKFLLEYSGLSQEELIAILRFIRDFVLFSYIRGEISAQNLKKYLIEQFKFPEERADMLLRYLNDNRLTIANNFLFRNTQDTNARVQRLEQNQIETLNQIKELITYIKKKFEGQGQPSFIG